MVLTEPLSDWAKEKIEEVPFLCEILADGVYLAGGLLRTIINAEPFDHEHTDVDLFFQTSAHLETVKILLENNPHFKKVYQCPEGKLASYVHVEKGGTETWKYQLVSVDYYEDMGALLDSFDFTCIMCGTDGKTFWYDERFPDAIDDKLLVWNKIPYPAASLRRLMKYARKGYTMKADQYQLFVGAIWEHDHDINDVELVYVD